jgi:hypothetical protein
MAFEKLTKALAYAIIEKIYRETEMIFKLDALKIEKTSAIKGAETAPRFFDFQSFLTLSVGD